MFRMNPEQAKQAVRVLSWDVVTLMTYARGRGEDQELASWLARSSISDVAEGKPTSDDVKYFGNVRQMGMHSSYFT